MNQPNRGAPVPYTGGQMIPAGMPRRERDILLAMLWSKFGAEFVAGERAKLRRSVHAMATCTINAIHIVPDASVSKQKIRPRGIAPIASASPFGICVAE